MPAIYEVLDHLLVKISDLLCRRVADVPPLQSFPVLVRELGKKRLEAVEVATRVLFEETEVHGGILNDEVANDFIKLAKTENHDFFCRALRNSS